MYSYQAYTTDGTNLLGSSAPTINDLRLRYFNQRKTFGDRNVSEIVVLKGRKIHAYYTSDFKLDKSKPAFIHNILYGR
tara:strand:+ start:418 stop:651 length:234 start_codon:yes stop_codon:yes gene_type:complete